MKQPIFHDVNSGPIGWRECGSGDPVIFLHAMVTSSTGWDPQMRALAPDFRCIAWDMPGFGASDRAKDDAGFDEALNALIELATGPLACRKAHFVGLSVGGMILQHLAARHPDLVGSITLLDCSPKFGFGGGGSGAEFETWVARQLDSQPQAHFCEGLIRAIVSPKANKTAINSAIAAMSRATRHGLEYAARLIARHDALALLPSITCPTLVMAGADDRETPPAYATEIFSRISDANLSIIPNAGHIANLEAPDAVSARLRTFLVHAV